MHNTDHLPEWTLDLLAEGALSHAERSRAEAHLRECALCAAEMEATRAVIASLEALPRFEPSPGFADVVMSRVVLPQEAPQAAFSPLRRWLPRTRRGWAGLAVALAVPSAPLFALLAWLLSRPMVTVGSLWSMGTGWVRETSWSLVARAAEALARSGALEWGGDLLDRLASAPATGTGIALLLVAAAIPLSGWTLVRLLRTPLGGVTHAH